MYLLVRLSRSPQMYGRALCHMKFIARCRLKQSRAKKTLTIFAKPTTAIEDCNDKVISSSNYHLTPFAMVSQVEIVFCDEPADSFSPGGIRKRQEREPNAGASH